MKKISRILSMCLIIVMLTTNLVFADININENINGALLGDLETGEILYEYNINQQLADMPLLLKAVNLEFYQARLLNLKP